MVLRSLLFPPYDGNSYQLNCLFNLLSRFKIIFPFSGLTVLASLSDQVSFLILTTLWISIPICYFIITSDQRETSNLNPTSFEGVPYRPIQQHSDDALKPELCPSDMLLLVWNSLNQLIAMMTSTMSRSLMLNGVVSTMSFTNVSITPRNQFIYYVLGAGICDFIGRSYLLYSSWCKENEYLVVKRTWIPALANAAILIVMVLASWFRFIPSFFAVAGLVATNALLSSIVFVNSFHNVGDELRGLEKMFCRSLMVSAIGLANMTVAVIGFDTESRLRKHCLLFLSVQNCFTRSLN